MNKNNFFHNFSFRPGGRPQEGNLTAASLIDAIITHQINQTATEPPTRDGHRPPFVCIIHSNSRCSSIDNNSNKLISFYNFSFQDEIYIQKIMVNRTHQM